MKSFAGHALAVLVAAMCGVTSSSAHAADVAFSGSAVYRERMALPATAALVVELIDLARPAVVLGETKVEPSGQVPIAFSLAVDSSKLAAGGAYALKARITVGDAVWFASGEPVPVNSSTAGASGLSLLLLRTSDKAASDAAAASPLPGTAWRLVALDGKDSDPTVTSRLVFNADGSVSGNGGCNNFAGGATIAGSALKFAPLASTMMACEEAKSKQEGAFHAALSRTVSYVVKGGELTLLDAAGSAVARLVSP